MEKKKLDPYAELGVSSKKEGVHAAIQRLDKGLYPGAFCMVLPMNENMPEEVKAKYAQVIHSDGVGTKSNVAYIARQEYAGPEIYSTLPQDAIVMNIDDMACVGIVDNINISNHVARCKNRFSDEDLNALINGYADFYALASSLGINIIGAGGETADVGSYTTTVGIDVTATANIEKDKIIDASNIKDGSYIVGLASYGKSTYEKSYNSGIRSNGLTLAINTLLNPYYRKYTETMDGTIDPNKLFAGKYRLEDVIKGNEQVPDMTVADSILSPTRTFVPVLKKALEDGVYIDGIIHCSGGGLTKAQNFGNGIRYVKYNLFPTPPMFKEIQEIRGIDDKDMYTTFNMGVGMEVVVSSREDAEKVIKAANSFGVDAQIIGITEACEKNEVVIEKDGKVLTYTKD